jgi:hypothetical protein
LWIYHREIKEMNKDNYVTLPVAQRLVAAGIVLETEQYWYISPLGSVWRIRLGDELTSTMKLPQFSIPAPSMSELWRELPSFASYKYPTGEAEVWLENGRENIISPSCVDINPCDALAELLIWVKEQIGGKKWVFA